MSGKAIGLMAGFEDLLGVLRGADGDLPSEGEMVAAEGLNAEISRSFYDQLLQSGQKIYSNISSLNKDLSAIEASMTAAIKDQLETDAAAATQLKTILTDLEGIQQDLSGDDRAVPAVSVQDVESSSRKFPNEAQ